MDSQYKLLSELLSDQAAFITSPKTSLANYWGGHCPLAPPPVSTGLLNKLQDIKDLSTWILSRTEYLYNAQSARMIMMINYNN